MARKIVVIDDEPDLVGTWVRVFEQMGHKCLGAYDGPQGIALIEAEHPDLVVTDLTLPALDGLEIVKHVRQNLPKTPVIVVTAYHTPHTAQAAYAAGAAAYLRKPFSTAELAKTADQALQSRPP